MTDASPLSPLLFVEDVRSWVQEKANLLARQSEIAGRVKQLDQKLDAVRLLLPKQARELIGDEYQPSDDSSVGARGQRLRRESPVTDLVMELLSGQNGGRAAGWIRDTLEADPEVGAKIAKSPSSVGNALGRLVQREKLTKVGGLYYIPETLARIHSGELIEEQQENYQEESLADIMRRVLASVTRFTAADAMALARDDARLSAKLKSQPGYVYSWLAREVFKKKLGKEGDYYFFLGEDGEGPAHSDSHAGGARQAQEELI